MSDIDVRGRGADDDGFGDRAHVVRGVCPHDCPDTCAWEVTVDTKSRRALAVRGSRAHPLTAGGLCTKVDRYHERTYHPDRVLTPLRRAGPKGAGNFVETSWDEALPAIAAAVRDAIARHGPQTLLPYSYAGTMGLLQGEGMAEPFFAAMGASKLARTICSEAGFVGMQYTLGRAIGMDTLDYAHARLVLIWGSNTLTSNLHLWPLLLQARKQGARLVCIDPVRTRTAAACDEWLPIRPGTDAALALAIMHVLFRDGLVDEDYIARYTIGAGALLERVAGWSPARAADVTGLPEARITALARAYGTTRPAAIRVNYGMQRHRGGGMAVRTIACLPALVGAWRTRGGGIQLSTSGSFPLDRGSLYRPELRARPVRTLNMNRLADALSLDPQRIARAHARPRPVDPAVDPANAGPPVTAMIVYNSNPAAVAPDQGGVVSGLRREDLHTVVLEHFLTDTCMYADWVLPATTQLEHWDIVKPYGHLYLGLNTPAIAPVGDTRPNSEIFRGLARALGVFDEGFARDDVTCLRDFLAAQTDPALWGLTFERLQEVGFARLSVPDPYLPFAEGNFPTESGKCEFFSEAMQRDGYDPLPNYTPPRTAEIWEAHAGSVVGAVMGGPGQHARAAAADRPPGPLVCLSPPAHGFLNSSFVNLERLRRREREPVLMLHPTDAAVRGLEDGQVARVRGEHDSLELVVRVSQDVITGTAVAPGVWWSRYARDGRNINRVTRQDEADMGSGATFYDVPIWVEALRGE